MGEPIDFVEEQVGPVEIGHTEHCHRVAPPRILGYNHTPRRQIHQQRRRPPTTPITGRERPGPG